ncbi:MAG TPA: SCE4755 family polysaccharide monooxygenase-like protein [Polyangiaceae bacterium]|nr:SCE4755 family polysaccharide monooxygenase-like protein [Polyangiaceae bacterium]
MTKAVILSLAAASAGVLVPSMAQAHFTLDYPPAWVTDSDSSGDPQKAFPCGVLSTDTYTPTNMVTMFSPGQKITVKWTEQIQHDGWFRIALSYKDGAQFQATTDFPEPTYQTSNGVFGMMSVDAGIESPVMPPVLMDGIDPHTAASVTPPKSYAQDITLPMMTCTKCTLQVLQIMLNHPVNPPNNVPGAGFTYHHCAFISILPGGDGGTQIVPDAGGGPMGGSGSSSGTSGTTSGSSAGTGGSTGTASSTGTGGAGSTGSASGGASQGAGGGTAGTNGTGGGGGTSSGEGAASGTSSDTGNKSSSGGGCSAALGAAPGVAGLSSLAVLAGLALVRRRGDKNAKR